MDRDSTAFKYRGQGWDTESISMLELHRRTPSSNGSKCLSRVGEVWIDEEQNPFDEWTHFCEFFWVARSTVLNDQSAFNSLTLYIPGWSPHAHWLNFRPSSFRFESSHYDT